MPCQAHAAGLAQSTGVSGFWGPHSKDFFLPQGPMGVPHPLRPSTPSSPWGPLWPQRAHLNSVCPASHPPPSTPPTLPGTLLACQEAATS